MAKTDEIDVEIMVGYLNHALDSGGLPAFLAGLLKVVKKSGLSAVADKSDTARENIYRALSPDGNPTVKTLDGILRALDMQLSIRPSRTEAFQHGGDTPSGLLSATSVLDESVRSSITTECENIMYALTDSADIRDAFENLQTRLRANSVKHTPYVSWPGGVGSGNMDVYWLSELGIWSISERYDGGMWFAFGTADPRGTQLIVPEVQINLADKGTSRRKAGVFIRDSNGNVHVAHKGLFTVYHERIRPMDYIQSHPQQQVGLVKWPGGDSYQYLIVAGIEDDNLLVRVETFVRDVRDYKSSKRNL